MLGGVLESFLLSGHEVDFLQMLEVLQHEGGQAVGSPVAGCLFGSRSSAETGACPLALPLVACAHTINNPCGSFK